MTALYIILGILVVFVFLNATMSVFPLQRITIKYKKGRHYATLWSMFKAWWMMGWFMERRLQVKLSQEAVNYIVSGPAIGDINKIVGRTIGFEFSARRESTRLGWRRTYDLNPIPVLQGEIMAMTETGAGNYEWEPQTTIVPNIWAILYYSIVGFGRPTVPYFGGDDPAPHDMKVEVRLAPKHF